MGASNESSQSSNGENAGEESALSEEGGDDTQTFGDKDTEAEEETNVGDSVEPDTTEGPAEEAVINTRLERSKTVGVDDLLYAMTRTSDGTIFVCGKTAIHSIAPGESEATASWISENSDCDAIIEVGDTLFWNSRSSGAVTRQVLPTGDSEAIAAQQMLGTAEDAVAVDLAVDADKLVVARGSAGVSIFSNHSDENRKDIADTHALSVAVIPESSWILVGTPQGVTAYDTDSESALSLEINNGSSQLGGVVNAENGWDFSSTNPTGITRVHLSTSGELELGTTLSPGSHPYMARKGVASLWSALVVLSKEEENDRSLYISGTYSSYDNAAGRTFYEHFVDVLDREGDSIVAATTTSVIWFDVVAQGQEPDVFAKNLVLKMSPQEEGGGATVLALIQNKGEAPLLVSNIAVDNDAFAWDLDPDFAGEVGNYEPTPLMAIDPGSSGFFEVSYAGGSTDSAVARVTVTSNDPDEEELTITARVNVANVSEGFEVPNILVPDMAGSLHALTDWKDKVMYTKLFNGL